MNYKKLDTEKMIYASLCITMGIVLPFFASHGFGIPGNILLPMHIPVLLCGFLCGPKWGLFCGMITPVLSSILTGMPSMYPMLPIMFCELSSYGWAAGYLYKSRRLPVWLSLPAAMFLGRIAYGLMFTVLFQMTEGNLKTSGVVAAIITGLPGIALQLVFIPVVVAGIERKHIGGFIKKKSNGCETCWKENEKKESEDTLWEKAIGMIEKREKTCVILKNEKMVYAVSQSGIGPLITALEESPDHMKGGLLADKIIGKAAAMIAVCAGIRRVYGCIMSSAAKEYLQNHGIEVQYGRCVDVINNRKGNGICPMEKSIMEIEDAWEGYQTIRQKLCQLTEKSSKLA